MTPDSEVEVETEVSLEDSLRDAFDAARVEPEAVEEPEASEPEETASEQAARERDEHGRFKAKEPAEEAAPAAEPEAAQEEVKPDPFGLAPQYAGDVVKAQWANLSPELRREYHERERTFHRELTKQDEERVFGRQVRNVVQPFEGLIRSLGAEPVQAVQYLLQTDAALRTAQPAQRVQMFLKAAADYGVDLSSLTGTEAAPTQQVDPALETISQRIARLENDQNAAINSRRETEQAQIDQSIVAFASDPEHVYFEQVKPAMAALLQNEQAGDLKEAYDMAVWANPATRALHLAALRESEDRKRTEAAKATAARARQASPSVTGAPGSAVPASHMNGSASNSVEDDLRDAFRSVAGRA